MNIRRHVGKASLLLLIGFFIFGSVVFAQEDPAVGQFEEKEIVVVGVDEVIDRDFFATGEVVEVSGTVNGDVYVAGGQVIIDGTVNGDLLAAGGTVTVSGSVLQDVRVAGGNIVVSGVVDRNVTVIGGNINITDNAAISGNVVGGGGNIEILAPISGDVTMGAGSLIVSGNVDGNINVAVGALRLGPDAQVAGDLTYIADERAVFSPDQIGGEVIEKQTPVGSTPPEIDTEEIGRFFAGIGAFFEIVWFIATLIVGLLFIHMMPRFMVSTSKTIQERPWKSLAVGFLMFILAPIVVVVLFITLIGMPLGLMLLASYLFGIYMAHIVAALFVGLYVVKQLKKKWNDGWAFIIGLLALTTLKIIPIVGWIALFIFMLLGLGSLFVTKVDAYHMMRKKKLL